MTYSVDPFWGLERRSLDELIAVRSRDPAPAVTVGTILIAIMVSGEVWAELRDNRDRYVRPVHWPLLLLKECKYCLMRRGKPWRPV